MGKLIPILLIIILIVTLLFPSLSGVDLGNKLIGEDSWIATQIKTIEPLAKAVDYVSQVTQKIVISIGNIIDTVVAFFKSPWEVIFKKKE